eukprot:TRINITY_DN17904_c0_g1_i5.p1 TRINITY_DN17904_c0_g1~~TRINITY_DN17904_c0_g1_i5.p1  ORF type:complete len:409 (-),score=79.09 TRINITY_DN17904_c0_g1_i5:42-1247(-)
MTASVENGVEEPSGSAGVGDAVQEPSGSAVVGDAVQDKADSSCTDVPPDFGDDEESSPGDSGDVAGGSNERTPLFPKREMQLAYLQVQRCIARVTEGGDSDPKNGAKSTTGDRKKIAGEVSVPRIDLRWLVFFGWHCWQHPLNAKHKEGRALLEEALKRMAPLVENDSSSGAIIDVDEEHVVAPRKPLMYLCEVVASALLLSDKETSRSKMNLLRRADTSSASAAAKAMPRRRVAAENGASGSSATAQPSPSSAPQAKAMPRELQDLAATRRGMFRRTSATAPKRRRCDLSKEPNPIPKDSVAGGNQADASAAAFELNPLQAQMAPLSADAPPSMRALDGALRVGLQADQARRHANVLSRHARELDELYRVFAHESGPGFEDCPYVVEARLRMSPASGGGT